MTDRVIDPRNYLDLAGGREDIAVALKAKDDARDHRAAIESGINAIGDNPEALATIRGLVEVLKPGAQDYNVVDRVEAALKGDTDG